MTGVDQPATPADVRSAWDAYQQAASAAKTAHVPELTAYWETVASAGRAGRPL